MTHPKILHKHRCQNTEAAAQEAAVQEEAVQEEDEDIANVADKHTQPRVTLTPVRTRVTRIRAALVTTPRP